MEAKITNALLNGSNELFSCEIDSKNIQIQKTRKEFTGDYTLVTFPFAKLMKLSPDAAAEKIGIFLCDKITEIKDFNVVKGFLNLELSSDYWLDTLKSISTNENFGFATKPTGKTIMVEFSSPNTNKPLHLGHLRNNFLGYSVAQILKANGNNVIKTQIINDRGIHICKSMLAWQKFAPKVDGQRETPQSTGMKGDKFVGKYYVEFDKALNIEAKGVIDLWDKNDFSVGTQFQGEVLKLQAIYQTKEDEKAKATIAAKIKELAKNATPILLEAKEMLVKWEANDKEVYELWTTMNNWVYSGFETTYTKMGVDFDSLYYESSTFLLGKDIVLEGLSKGIFFKKEDGSIWVDLTSDGLDEKLLLRGDGTAVYMTQDIGTAIERFREFPSLSGVVYTVGNEQDYHFSVLFLILKKLGYSWAQSCFHLSYGMVDLPTGKMKSREGTVVDADDLIDEVVEAAREMTQERGHLEGFSDANKTKLYQTIGLGGLKYYLLKVDPKKRMMFDPAESIELTGNTGPFIQYTYARIQSLLSKAEVESTLTYKGELPKEEHELIKWMYDFKSVVKEAGDNYSPALLANYLYELVKLFNHFYQSVPPIVKEEDQKLKQLRLYICKETGNIIERGMNLLGINVPERM